MKEMERKIEITYRWWINGRRYDKIKPEHYVALEESAEKRIHEMMDEGYLSGELNDNIRMTDDDPEDGIEYKGWWEIKRT
ncbi:MAG: hypothetical protein WC119_00580 [Synergistaceae bacterium]